MRGSWNRWLPLSVVLCLACTTATVDEEPYEDGGTSSRRDAGRPVLLDAGQQTASSSSGGGGEDAGQPDGSDRPQRDGGTGSSSSSGGSGSSSSSGGSSSSSLGPCSADNLEPNNTPAAATAVTTGTYQGTVCPADVDVFTVNLTAGQQLDVTVEFTHASGNLDAYLHGPNAALLVSAESPSDDENLSITAQLSGPHFITVRGADAQARNSYRLRVNVGMPPAPTCQDDALEQNDSPPAARAVGAGSQQARICPNDPDFFRIDLNAGDRLGVTLTYAQSEGDLDVEVLGALGEVLDSGTMSTGTENVLITALTSSAHYIRVFGKGDAQGAYQLQLSITPTSSGCMDDSLEPNDNAAGASAITGGTINAVICSGDDDFFAIQANNGDTLDVELALASGTPNLDVHVLAPDGSTLSMGTNPGGDTLSVSIAQSGRHVIRVTAPQAITSAAAYQLVVGLDPGTPACTDDPFEDNDSAATARALAVGSHAAAICSQDADFFKFTVGTGDQLDAIIEFNGDDTDLDMYLLGPDGTVLDSSDGVTGTEAVSTTAAAAGEYVLRIVGYDGSAGSYTLDVSVTPAIPTCHEDAFEENDTRTAARTVMPGSLNGQVCGGDDDYFGIALNAGDALTGTLTFTHGSGADLDMVLFAPDGTVLAESSTVQNTETVTTTASAAGTYVVQVLGYNGSENSYALNLAVTPAAPTCSDDGFEDNDTQQAARLVGAGTFNAKICGGDDDFYQVTLNAQDTLKIDLAFTHSAGDLDVRLFDASGAQVAQSTGSTDDESITYQAAAAGTYTFRVYGYQGAQNDYDMTVRIDPFNPPCTDDALEDNDSAAAARAIMTGTTGSLRYCRGDEDFYTLPINAGDTLSVQLATSTAGQNLDVQVLDGAGAVLATAATTSGNESLSFTATQPGPVHIRVFSTLGNGADYSLTTSITPAAPSCTDDAQEQNDALASAKVVSAQTYQNLMVCSGDDDYYAVDVPAGATVTFTINFTHANGDLDLSLLDAQGTVINSSTTTASTESVSTTVTAASRVTARVYGYRAAQNGYSLTVSVTGGTPSCADDSLEDNDTAATASTVGSGRMGRICAGDPDWFRVTLGTGDTLVVDLTFTHANGDLDMRLHNPQGAVVASSTSASNNERITYTATAAGTFTVEVYGYRSAENSYSISTMVTPPAGCMDDAQEPNDSGSAARPLPTSSTSLTICPNNADWFSVTLVGGETLTATATFTHANGDLDLRIYDTDATTVLAASVTTGNTESASWQAPVGRTVYVRISGVAGAQNSYALSSQKSLPTFTCPADDALEPNDSRENASPLPRDTVRVGQICASDPDWFAVGLETGDALTLDLTLSSGTGDVDLYLHNWTGSTSSYLARSIRSAGNPEQLTYTATTPGVYFVRVAGVANAQNRYALHAAVTPAPGTCQEDAWEDSDSIEQARTQENAHLAFPTDTVPGQICPSDEDWYDVYVFDDEELVVDLKYDHELGDLDISLVDDTGAQVASSVDVTGTERLVHQPTESGFFYVRVRGYSGAFGPYTLMSDVHTR